MNQSLFLIHSRCRILSVIASITAMWFCSPFQVIAADTLPSWIWANGSPADKEEVFFRKLIPVPADIVKAILVASADNSIEVTVNGTARAVSSKNWAEPAVEIVTDLIKAGQDNLIAAKAKNEGGIAGAMLYLELTNRDGVKTIIVSDQSWSAGVAGGKDWDKANFVEQPEAWAPATIIKPFGEAPWGSVSSAKMATLLDLRTPQATPVEDIKLLPGFTAELLYSVPKGNQGSWVAMTIDDKERLLVSDQYGSLYRLPVPEAGKTIREGDVEKIALDIGGAQGLLYAFDSLYAVLNTAEHGGRGLYRISDSDGDDIFDTKVQLRKFDEIGGEHGPHAVLLSPDGKSLRVVCGNQTPLTAYDHSRVPTNWGEDLLLERPIGKGFMKDTLAPGGWIAQTDPEGKSWEVIATGFRNQYDAAFNDLGDLFTYDADMEWDMNTPWYRPTRINLVASGAEFGWRHGGGKWPAYYPDSLPAVIDIGPGSPTGVCFGYGAKFPAKYQKAFFACDWSYGKLYAVHLEAKGSTYEAQAEEFMSAQPLPLTDLLVNPADGALYIAIGGRRVQSGLYRVSYTGTEATDPAPPTKGNELHALRLSLENFHRRDANALDHAWPQLGHEDRYIRYAARIAVEHQPAIEWQDRALAEKDPEALINVMIALARQGDPALQAKLIEQLLSLSKLSPRQELDRLRALGLAFTRMGEGTPEVRASVSAALIAAMPYGRPEHDAEALQIAVYLQTPEAAALGIELLKGAPSQEEQMAYVKSLRHLTSGWNTELRRELFAWFARAKGYRGGASFELFISEMKDTALSHTSEADKLTLKEVIESAAPPAPAFTAEPRSFVQAWTVADFDDVLSVGLEGNRDFSNGRNMFGAASCFACHRFGQEGGVTGPDLTSVSGKFSPRDLLESIIEPSKEISDQYGQMVFEMLDGSVQIGRVMNLSGDNVMINTDMLNPNQIVGVDRKRLKSMHESPVSMMPPGLLYNLTKDDVLDLMAYLLAAGDESDPMFSK
jgi:putative heme-binding domain-containing protein